MKKMISAKILAAVLSLSFAVGSTYAVSAFAAPAAAPASTTSVEVKVDVQQAAVNWEKGAAADVTAMGIGLPPVNAGPRGNALARRAAIVDAQRNLLEVVEGVQIDSETLVKDMAVESDIIKSQVHGLIKGARVVKEGSNPDGSYFVEMSIPLFGATQSLAAAVLPEATKNIIPEPAPVVESKPASAPAPIPGTKAAHPSTPASSVAVGVVVPVPPAKQEVKAVTYTGIVIDATGLGMEPTFSPVIYDVNGRAIYGMQHIDKNMAISKGMVEYSNNLEAATGGTTRAGSNPLVIKATAVKGGVNSVNPVNAVVSVEDGDRILMANANANIFGNCAVVFVK